VYGRSQHRIALELVLDLHSPQKLTQTRPRKPKAERKGRGKEKQPVTSSPTGSKLTISLRTSKAAQWRPFRPTRSKNHRLSSKRLRLTNFQTRTMPKVKDLCSDPSGTSRLQWSILSGAGRPAFNMGCFKLLSCCFPSSAAHVS